MSGNDSVWCGDRYDDVFLEEEKKNARETLKAPERLKFIHSAWKRSQQKETFANKYRSYYNSDLTSHTDRPIHANPTLASKR